MKRIAARDWFAIAVLAAAIFSGGFAALQIWRASRDDARVTALAQGRDVAVGYDDGGVAQAARARYLATHKHMDEALAIADRMLNGGDPAARASLLYALANIQMRQALGAFKTQPMRVIAPIINQAKSEYRQALSIDPGNWDARYNEDIAAALVRDSDAAPAIKGHEMARERALWPDVPGTPNGLP